MQFYVILASIFGLDSIRIVKRIKQIAYTCRIGCNLFAKAQSSRSLIGTISIRQRTLLDITAFQQCIVNSLCKIVGNHQLFARFRSERLSLEQVYRHLDRTRSNSFCHFGLEGFRKVFVAFIRDNCQHVYGMNIAAKDAFVHAFAFLIHAQAQTTAHFLPFTDIGGATLERANLENVLVVPTLLQCRMAEYKANGFLA